MSFKLKGVFWASPTPSVPKGPRKIALLGALGDAGMITWEMARAVVVVGGGEDMGCFASLDLFAHEAGGAESGGDGYAVGLREILCNLRQRRPKTACRE